MQGSQPLHTHQLIAAKLNVANGTDVTTAGSAITAADNLLAQFGGKLPYNVASSSTVGQQMVAVASRLDDFNSDGELQPGCSTVSCSGMIGDFVWNDINRNGIQEAGEPGIAGLTVVLKNAQGVTIGTQTTNADGYYSFSGVCAGSYTVTVIAPATFTSTMKNAPGSTAATDSNGSPASVTLPANNSSDQTIDFGFYTAAPGCTGSIGDFVWSDADGDGIQDSGEAGLAGVILKLKNGGGALLATATTNGSGQYQFTGVCAGTYAVEAVTPANFTPTTKNAPGSTTANDSNGSPASVALPTNGTSNQTIDFGFKPAGTANACGLTWGYWKNHLSAWPVSSLVMGSQTYTKTQLLALLGMAVREAMRASASRINSLPPSSTSRTERMRPQQGITLSMPTCS